VIGLDDLAGRQFVLECSDCSETKPAELVVGLPEEKRPFRQEGGRLQVKVGPEKTWLELMVDTVIGPEEKLIPLAVEGTVFIVDASEDRAVAVTVVAGVVAVGKKGLPSFRRVQPGRRLRIKNDKIQEEPAPPGELKSARELFKATEEPPPEIRRAPFGRFLQYLLIGGGICALGGGLVSHYQAANTDGDEEDLWMKRAKYLYIGGGAAVVVGFAWVILQSGGALAEREPGRSSPRLVPAIIPGGFSLDFNTRF
jgi:hypothetical protein